MFSSKGLKFIKTERFKLILSSVLLVAWAVVIFGLSSNNGNDSSSLSNGVISWLLETVVPGYKEWEPSRQAEVRAMLVYPIRKLAHFFEYAVLGCLATAFFFQLDAVRAKKASAPVEKSLKKTPAVCAFVFLFLFACTDELHQLFVNGRTGKFSDVLIDTIGASCGIVLVVVIRYFVMRHKKKRDGM